MSPTLNEGDTAFNILDMARQQPHMAKLHKRCDHSHEGSRHLTGACDTRFMHSTSWRGYHGSHLASQ